MKRMIRSALRNVFMVVLAINLLLPAAGAHAQSSCFPSGACAGCQSSSVTATAPVVSAFTLPATSTSPDVPVLNFTASDNVGVAGYLITNSAAVPAASANDWSSTTPVRITAASGGATTFYAWAKDAEGNVSAPRRATVTITPEREGDVTKPGLIVSTLDDDAITNSRTVNVSGNAMDDGVLQSVTINGTSAQLDANGNFSEPILLMEGENVITVVATDAAGNSTTNARAITYIINTPELARISLVDKLARS